MSDEGQLRAGTIVAGRYRLDDPIGRGGMGTVWRALDQQERRPVALKIITPRDPDGKPSETAIGRFLREFRALDRLRSPHVVKVFDHASDGELVYISMELLEGETLRDQIKRRGRIDVATTLRVLTHVGRAVALAHARGIVHRDIKPGNIFICPGRDQEQLVAKVLDFGMAKSLATPLATVDPVRTELGRPLGTPYYMSPEQARGMAKVDHRSDLWAIGVIAYECLVGERPFTGRSLAQVFAAIATGDLPVPSRHANVPAGFDAWFQRAVARDVQERFQSAKVMLEELEEVLGEATTLKRVSATLAMTLGATLGMTTGDVAETLIQPPSFGERTLRRPPPTAGTSFVGREQELSALAESIDSHCRVLTVRGPAGTGRRRLLHEFSARESARFPGGAWSCSLADAADPETLWLKLAIALGLRLSDHDPVERIGRALFGLGRILLVLEDVDRIADHLAPALTRWLSAAPSAVFAVTSRRELEVPTESALKLQGLSSPSSAHNIEQLGSSPAAELFLRRAISFRRQLLAAHGEAAAIATLCRRVFGHPLAIEILASLVEQLEPSQIVAAMDRSLVQPGGTTVMHPDRIVSGAINWAWAQRSLAERAALAQCAVFRGGFTVQAAEAVVDLAAWPDAPPVAELLERFAKRALLRRTLGAFGEGRFEMHPRVRELCLDRLEGGRDLTLDSTHTGADARAALLERHDRYFAQLGSEEALDALTTRGGPLRRGRYALEWDNVCAALENAGARSDPDTAAELSLAAGAVQSLYGRHAAAARTLLRGVVEEGTSDALRLRSMRAQGEALLASGRLDAARDVLGRAAHKAHQLGDLRRLGDIQRVIGDLSMTIGQLDSAQGAYAQARHYAEQRGDRTARAEALRGLATVSSSRGDSQGAVRMLREALVAHSQLGARRLEADTQAQIAAAYNDPAHRAVARAALESALAIYRELGERFEEARVLGRLGALAAIDGRIDHGIEQLEQAVGRSGELGARTLEGELLGVIAELQARRGKLERAWPAIARAEHLLRSEAEASYPLARLLCRRAHIEKVSRQRDKAVATLAEVRSMMPQLPPGGAARIAGVVARVERALGA